MKVQNMTNSRGNKVKNQFIITTDHGIYFQSYNSTIALVSGPYAPNRPVNERLPHQKIMLDEKYWDYSATTGRYRNQFLGETKAETQKKIDSGEYILTNLNS